MATGKLLNSSRILTGGLLPPKINNNCQVDFVTCYGKIDPDTTCTRFNPSNPTVKSCSQVCSDGGDSWCKVFIGGGINLAKPFGCKGGKYSYLYGNIPKDYKNNSNLWNCRGNTSAGKAPYNYYTEACCQYGCTDVLADIPKCEMNGASIFSSPKECYSYSKRNNTNNYSDSDIERKCDTPCINDNQIFYRQAYPRG